MDRISDADCRVATAAVWLIMELAMHPLPVDTLFGRGHDVGYTRQELQRAARLLHIVRSKRVGCGMWVWMLTSAKECKRYRRIGLHLISKADKTLQAIPAQGRMANTEV